ncbi:MAG: heme-binding protein [Chitinophagales bacterium]|nr:heme-binding protein [Chitinophagales bacterium]
MKYLILFLSFIVVLLFAFQIWAYMGSRNIETYPYEVMISYDDFEIRKYEAANFTLVTTPGNNYSESSGSGFRVLAGYIFGGNSTNEKIAMTSPVEMELKDSITMKFMVPSKYDLDDLPVPDNSRIRFKNEKQKLVAAISFGGWANDRKIEKHKQKLISLMAKEGIEHDSDFSFLGYDSPFVWIGRKNEIIVGLKKD